VAGSEPNAGGGEVIVVIGQEFALNLEGVRLWHCDADIFDEDDIKSIDYVIYFQFDNAHAQISFTSEAEAKDAFGLISAAIATRQPCVVIDATDMTWMMEGDES
jgi:hypothetical protein